MFLTVSTLALVVFILVLGDMRRKYTAVQFATWYADELTERLGGTQALPLNLKPDAAPEHARKVKEFEWLPREDARQLRGRDGRILVARTRPVNRSLAPDGRAVVFFTSGTFHTEWLALAEFDDLDAAQRRTLLEATPAPADPPPGGP